MIATIIRTGIDPIVVVLAILSVIAPIATFIFKAGIDAVTAKKEDKEIRKEVYRYVEIMDKGEKDVLSLMIKNVADLREYYVINKQQARRSFSAVLLISILGFVLFAGGIIITYPAIIMSFISTAHP